MKVTETKLKDVKIIEMDVFGDHRGFFTESYSKEKFVEAGIDFDFVQDNHPCPVKLAFCGACISKKVKLRKLN